MESSKRAAVAALAVMCLPDLAWSQAQEPSTASAEPALQEVVVTVQRRNENLQNVPITVNAMTSEELTAAHIESTYDLASLTPGLTSYQATGLFMPHLRGVGNTVDSVGIENPVAMYVDGVFYASMPGALLSLNNIDRVEVDYGPQGTLFGRNATGGVIQISTREPAHQFSGTLGLGYGNYNTVAAEAYVTGGITDSLAGDLAAYLNDRTSGYGTNLYNGESIGNQQEIAVRTKWLWRLSDLDTLHLIGDYARSDGSQYVNNRYVQGTIPLGAPPFSSSNPWDVQSQTQPSDRVEQYGATLNYEHDFGFAQLVSITGYRKTKADAIFSFSLYPFDIGANLGQSYSQVSEELHLLSAPQSKIQWLVGYYYLDAPASSSPFNLIGDFLPVIAGAPANPITNNTVTDVSHAVFGQTTIPLIARTDLTLGVRYTAESRGIHGDVGLIGIPASFSSFDAHQDFSAWTWHIALEHHFTDDLMGYISDSRGFRAGTYNGAGTSVAALITPVRPEQLDAYEIGLKSEFNRRFTANAAAFYYDYRNIQVPIYLATGVTVLSGPHAELYGTDLNFDMAVTSRLKVQAGVELLHTEFLSFPSAPFFSNAPTGGLIGYGASANGKELPVAPKTSFNLLATYRIPLKRGDALSFSTGYYFKGRWFSGPDNSLAAPESNSLTSTIAWSSPSDRYQLEIWGHNLLNEQIVARLSRIAPWGDVETLEPPRTFGGTARVNF